MPASCFLWRRTPEPNLLLIVVDSLRFDAISQSLGAARTPAVHALVDDGVSMTGCFSHTPVNDAALAALFSSRMPHRSGMVHDLQTIDPDLPLLAEELADEGYVTLASVSRDLTVPTDRDPADRGLLRGFQHVHLPEYEQWPAEDVNAAALTLLRDRDPSHPWFLLAHFSDPHEPYEAYQTANANALISFDGDLIKTVPISNTTHWQHEFDLVPGKHRMSFKADTPLYVRDFKCHSEGQPLPTAFLLGTATESAKTIVVSIENPTTAPLRCKLSARIHDAPSLAQVRERYRLEVEHVDHAIGALIEELKSSNQYDNTCIVLTATHGQALGERGQLGASDYLYDEVLRVPLIVKPIQDAPALAALRKKRNMLLRHIDLAPSIMALLDAGRFPDAEGFSILEQGERLLIAETRPPEAPSMRVAIRDDRYKMIYDARDRRYEMFDLRVDTLELENVFMLQGHLRMPWQTQLRQLTFEPNDPRGEAAPQADDGVKPVETSALQR